jgi:hypothetical protein
MSGEPLVRFQRLQEAFDVRIRREHQVLAHQRFHADFIQRKIQRLA